MSDDPYCFECGHLQSDHPRGGHCGAADPKTCERCLCQRFDDCRIAVGKLIRSKDI